MAEDQGPVRPANKWASVDTDAYDKRWAQMEAAGGNPHGEVDFVMAFEPGSVLDAGCGTGRVAVELARRGVDVVGADLDGPMIDAARAKAPALDFRLADLVDVQLDRNFDVVVMAGNVMIFTAPGTEPDVVANMAAHVAPGGRLVSGFQLGRSLDAPTYERAADDAGLQLEGRFSTWDREPAGSSDDYVVFVHRKGGS